MAPLALLCLLTNVLLTPMSQELAMVPLALLCLLTGASYGTTRSTVYTDRS